MNEYSGEENGIPLLGEPVHAVGSGFAVNIPSLPSGASPIIDETSGDCVGYIHEGAKNVWHIYDISGQHVGIRESPLEEPLIDPLDLILLGPVALKLVRAGIGSVSRLVAGRAVLGTASQLTRSLLPLLRSKLKGVSVRNLKFTETTLRHMENPGRFVPVHIIHLAIKHGKRMPRSSKSCRCFQVRNSDVQIHQARRWVRQGTENT
jgi:hypothetical protein